MAKAKPHISVIVPALDAAETIEACLRAALSQCDLGLRHEVILVDRGSRDRTAEIGERLGVRVIHQPNADPSAARNVGTQAAEGEIIATTDADCRPSPAWLHHLTRPFEQPDVAGVMGTYRTEQRELTARFVQQEYSDEYRRMSRQPQIDSIDTYSAAYRKDVLLAVGGFDGASTGPSVESQTLSSRLTRHGYRMAFAPQAVVCHRHDRNVREYLRRKFAAGLRKATTPSWERACRDTHIAPALRWQFTLLAVLLVLLPTALFRPPALWGVGVALTGFFLSEAPFLIAVARDDRAVLVIAPLLSLLRAGAFGMGFARGLFSPPRRQPRIQTGLSPAERFLKRSLDLVGGLLGVILSAPLLFLAAIAIKLDDGGPVFFSQERAGENGKPFRVFKLRTMVVDAPAQVATVLARNPLNGPVYKIPDDPRVTHVGRFLRRWSVDEMPQFWNVVRGEMSLVGPRPEETWVVAKYDERQRHRLVVKPGVTGPMQVSGRGELDMDTRLALELEYINHYSLWRDLLILARTLPAVFSGKGAF